MQYNTYQDAVDYIKSRVASTGITSKQLMGGNVTDIPCDNNEVIKHYEIYTFPTKADGGVEEKKVVIQVKYDSNDVELGAQIRGNVPEDYVAPAPVVDTKKLTFDYLTATYGEDNVAFSGVKRFEGLDVGIFTINPGQASESKISVTLFKGDTAPTIVPYVPIS